MTGIDKLILAYNSADISDMNKSLLRAILKNLRNISHMSIYDLADDSFSSTASISRLVKKLGYKNYHYFQKDITDCVNKYEFHNRIIPVETISEARTIEDVYFNIADQLLERMRNELDMSKISELAQAMHDSKRVILYDFDGGMSNRFLQFDLFMDGKLCEFYYEEQQIIKHANTLNQDDLVLVFTTKQLYYPDVDAVMDLVARSGATSCFVADSKHISSARRAAYQFVLPGVLTAIDFLTMESFLCILTMKYRSMFCEPNS